MAWRLAWYFYRRPRHRVPVFEDECWTYNLRPVRKFYWDHFSYYEIREEIWDAEPGLVRQVQFGFEGESCA